MSETKNFTLRLPIDLYKEMKQLADKNFRPLSKEIIVAINEYINNHKD
ncbi:DNA-binding protein [Limosilactobacillus reuteri]|nr:DNA-binding protein [Limosilactobacillus reuteri]MCC4435860.1 DNA-binding protein [Limosilactobacillus reuteri]MCC4438180.1 DNA-binding protein [Limosilactobacillus reuteri]MCC4442630.1 DNA-binding protein [Limosilactobacillus reuteri]MCC4444248.1 DNA-binding protein [Limosilactobacillus reuteri]MCC4445934.1 DNA-binding protein [Limosilactobacillus reuteri]